MGGNLLKHVKNVLIVGGGVGGAATAIRMAERGVSVDLVDIQDDWGAAGTGVTLSVLTARALCDLGFAEQLMKHGNLHDTITFYDAAGEIQHTHVSPRLYSPDVPAEGGILRPTLHKILEARLRELGVSIRTGTTITELTQKNDKVDVVFTDNSSGSYDLLIGADGLNSDIRDMVKPDASKPFYTGQVCWRAQFKLPDNWDGPRFYFGPNKVGFTPCGEGQMYMYLLENVKEKPWYKEEELLSHLLNLLKPFGGELGKLRDSMDENTPVMARSLESIVVDDPWHTGRVILIGDAAHSTTPHLASGAGMAVEDAIVLVDELDKADDYDSAMDAFMARRFPRGKLVVGNSLRLGQLEQDGAPAEEMRQLMMDSMQAIAEPY